MLFARVGEDFILEFLGIEIDIRPVRPVEEFKIAEQGSTGPNILDVEDLAPAIVTDNNVRNEPVATEPIA